ncbi:MAG: hypothetical protein LQ343_003907 [Gyalolechia ehrenbergii]|nr:MAG: hypothetical protein LQ343_003907 [Gyalolechia ehrenbergii]
MAFRQFGGSPKKALPGEILQVIHDFEARSPDELSLSKGERIELIERDDDFGDGWYLGKHLLNGKTGLFPEVYTTTTPKTTNVFATTFSAPDTSAGAAIVNAQLGNMVGQAGLKDASGVPVQGTRLQNIHNINAATGSPTPPPLNTTPSSPRTPNSSTTSGPSSAATSSLPSQRSISMAFANHRGQGEESPVMNETLSVIDEHITDMNTPGSSLQAGERRGTNDSGSEYSSHIDHRLSYIAGNETDEEEHQFHTRNEVMAWSPSQVAEGLRGLGVESRHCDFFKQQEITGEILLEMDQETFFMPALDLGVVGRRLRTWHKIKALQDEIRNQTAVNSIAPTVFTAESLLRDFEPALNRSVTNPSPLPITHSPTDRPASRPSHARQLSRNGRSTSPHLAYGHQRGDSRVSHHSFSGKNSLDSPARPSAASVRELNRSRRHSTVDLVTPPASDPSPVTNAPMTSIRSATSPHKKTPSLDRNWTMGIPIRTASARPASAISMSTDYNTFDRTSKDTVSASRDLDRGYVSGSEAEGKKMRNVLKKRDVASASHSRNNSHLDDHQRASQVGFKRQSRFGSVDSIRDTVAAMTSPASRMYHGNSVKSRFRNSSANEMGKTSPMLNTLTSPAVTKLEYDEKPRMKIVTSSSKPSSPKPPGDGPSAGSPGSSMTSPQTSIKPRMGLRAISDAVTGNEKAFTSLPVSSPSLAKVPSINSPARTGSTTPSRASEVLDRESTDASSKGTAGASVGMTPTSGTTRQKRKKETSAYIRGLEQRSPQEQMTGCDYSGWMKKKSSNLMTTWKPRLFILRGRRLSYFYTENDTEEKGLIDISSHRVLPADNDIITGFHATVTGAKSSPVSPQNTQTMTVASQEAAARIESTLGKDKSDSVFIFKLVPPRSGLSRAVNFTKPTVHYFAVENVIQGRLWMAALMKATIDRDETKPITTTYQQKTISLAKARMLRHRPPALMNLDEKVTSVEAGPKSDETGLNIQGFEFDARQDEAERKRGGSLSVEPGHGATSDPSTTAENAE